MKKMWGVVLVLAMAGAVSLTTGCAFLVAGGAAAAAGSGTYLYINGAVEAEYQAPFEKVWEACERVVAELHGRDVVPTKDISSGTIEAVIDGEKVVFTLNYRAKDVTKLAIRVGTFGDRLAAQRLHDKVGEYLKKS
jgi:hypothetical protein